MRKKNIMIRSLNICIPLILCINSMHAQNYFSKHYDIVEWNESVYTIHRIGDTIVLLGNGVCKNLSQDCTQIFAINYAGALIYSKVLDWIDIGTTSTLPYHDSIIISGDKPNQYLEHNVAFIDKNGVYDEYSTYYPTKIFGQLICSDRIENQVFTSGTSIDSVGDEELYVSSLFSYDIKKGDIFLDTFYIAENGTYSATYDIEVTGSGNLMFVSKDFVGIDERAFIWSTDTQGNKLWRLNLNPRQHLFYYPRLCELNNGSFVTYWTSEDLPYPDYILKDLFLAPVVFHNFNEDMTINWTDTLHTSSQEWKEIYNVVPLSDGGFVAVGKYILFEYGDYYYYIAYATKYNEQGEQLWERYFFDENKIGDSYFLDAEELENGDLIFAGKSSDESAENLNNSQFSWVVKTDSSGCLEADCDTLNFVTGINIPPKEEDRSFEIFPNPFYGGELSISFSEYMEVDQVYLVDVFGEIKLNAPVTNSEEMYLQPHLASGVYFCLLLKEGKLIAARKFVKI